MKGKTTSFSLSEDIIKDLLAEAKFQLADATCNDNSRQDRVTAMGLYMETLAGLDAAGLPQPEVDKDNLPADLVYESLADLSAESLEEAAEEISAMIEDAIDNPLDAEHLDVVGSQLDWLLLYRQRFHRRLAGAKKVIGDDIDFSEEQSQAVEYFDNLLKPLVWGLVFRNLSREGHALMVAPENRDKYWWWFEAIDLRWESLAAASELAEIIERYPSFERYFNRLRRSSRVRLGLTKAEPSHLKATAKQCTEDAAAKEFRLAASSPKTKVLKELTEFSSLILTADKGYRLWLNVSKPDSLQGVPHIKLPDGRMLDAEEAGSAMVWCLEGKLPEKVVLIANFNGKHIEEEISLE